VNDLVQSFLIQFGDWSFFWHTITPNSSSRLSQDGLVRFQIFLNGFYPIAGSGDPFGVRLAQLVMYQQFADRLHTEMRIRHTPDLTGCQWLPTNAANHLCFHGFIRADLLFSIKDYRRKLCAPYPQTQCQTGRLRPEKKTAGV
jgi:hypothetical protein